MTNPSHRGTSSKFDYLKFAVISFGALLTVLGADLIRQKEYEAGGAMIGAGTALVALKDLGKKDNDENKEKDVQIARLEERLEAQGQIQELLVKNAILEEQLKAQKQETILELEKVRLEEQLKIRKQQLQEAYIIQPSSQEPTIISLPSGSLPIEIQETSQKVKPVEEGE